MDSHEKNSSSEFESETESFLPYAHQSANGSIETLRPIKRWPWVISTAVLSLLSLFLVTLIILQSPGHPTCPAWRESDFSGVRDSIEYVDVSFKGNSAFDENGVFYTPHPITIDYVGSGPHVDEAWANLTWERDILISENEAKELWGEKYKVHWNRRSQGYEIGFDMFHTLHCLDRLRQLYYPDTYPVPEEHRDLIISHRGHCINQIRQYIMCAGDMSPYGSIYYENPGRNYADSDVVHTCRNFDKLREWTRNRYHAGGELHIPNVDVWDTWHEELQEWQ